jgi:hypothetical protein
MTDAHDLARFESREACCVRELQRVKQSIGTEVHGQHGGESRFGAHNVTAMARRETRREMSIII